ncbi:High-affinity branched-chain amino acid transport ATP-binding protein LivF [Fundidesulfovibrio magnetotacticus]|uniref:High-affinity branched-chain amino acid transport ATP-binding protein LivF n=1 Tax=Fundidesulfovibrio magnetotacticus TaxID=2730080 RepID=A0A6V8LRJ4_9BACT|nr:ABC transporter ATP-binding protein [Fundidesulfovibrio magnetotacticus]GFK92958.1 High-affinity branched-chain amino acid transport ATP-binding protein LivF [Fundidesulfovibrio magnetotacticus]
MLELDDVTLCYGAVQAVRGASLRVEQGEIVTLIGANGAGKTTILRAVSRMISPRSGVVRFEGRDLAGLTPDRLVRLGMSHCPEGRQVLARQSVRDNLILGAYVRTDKDAVQEDLEKAFQLFPRLRERASQLAGTLSGGEQQMLAIARAMMSRPKLLLMDEPSLGLAPIIVREIFEIIQGLNAQGVTILLVEQNAHLAMKTAHRAYVLEAGSIVAHGDAKELAGDQRVRKAYLG